MNDVEIRDSAESSDTNIGQLELLATYRRRLGHQLRRQALLGEAGTPPGIAIDIEDTRAYIAQIKAELRAAGVVVDDQPNDVAGAMPRRALALSDQERRNRSRMLAKVRLFWVEGVLEKSVYREALIALGMEERPKAIARRWDVDVQLDGEVRPLPPGTRIIEAFDNLGGELLILGAPGSGKTTLLLELARELIARAEADESHPIPVVFTLSTWAEQRLPLEQWLVAELNERYDVPQAVGRAWVKSDAILPLLDGLDEVRTDLRDDCVEAINAFRCEHGLMSISICSRQADYEALAIKLRLHAAILIQPLKPEQIDAYIAGFGEQLTGVRTALAEDPVLRELAQTPVMLNMIILTYQGEVMPTAPQTSAAIDVRRERLSTAYVARMLARRGAGTVHQQKQVIAWLTWLGRQMVGRGQTVFFIEQLQPDWLPTPVALRQYVLLDRVVGALIVGLTVGIACSLILGDVSIGIVAWLGNTLLAGLFGGQRDLQPIRQRDFTRIVRSILLGGLIVGLASGLAFWLADDNLTLSSTEWISASLTPGLVGALVALLVGGPGMQPRQINVVETFRWSWTQTTRFAASGFGLGFVVGLVNAYLLALTEPFRVGLLSGIIVGLIAGMVGGLVGGAVETRVRPNQGVWRSARSAMMIGLGALLITGPLAGLGLGWWAGLGDPIFIGVIYGTASGIVGALSYGGYACLSHSALRLVLWINGYAPINYVRFLDRCTEHILLRKVGGGYIFIHRLLMEHFASMDPAVPAPLETTSRPV